MTIKYIYTAVLAAFFVVAAHGLAARAPAEFLLGPTGMTGTYTKKSIKVTRVAEGSPADGFIEKGDEIIGLGSAKFSGDVRRALAAAIDQAETDQAGGKLNLMLNGGRQADLQLEVLGAYSESAPYNCPKTEKIIRRAADYLAAEIETALDPENRKSRGQFNSGATHTALLGLMATGEKPYIDLVGRAIAKSKVANPDYEAIEALLDGTGRDLGYVGWYWGYNCILLGEYYLLTGDESVLPALKAYAVGLARGQDAGGLWGHRLATNGRLPGYAQMNQSSLSSYLGMLVAWKCGIDDPALKKGIKKTSPYFASHVGRGTFKYGVHGPNPKEFNNNGMSGLAAVCMDLRDNKEGVKFFSRMCSTSYDTLERGHASNFFNPLWTPLGANYAGPDVTQQFFDNSLWFHTTYRHWDGSFHRKGKEFHKEGSQTGAALLTHCLPRKALLITGREADPSLWLKGDEATAAVRMSQIDYNSKTVEELLEMFDHPMPMVRIRAVWSLRDRDSSFVPRVAAMLNDGNKLQKTSAMEYFGYKCPPEQAHPQIDTIGRILRDGQADPELREKAAKTLSFHGEPAYRYYKDMLQLVLDEEPEDHFREIDQSVGESLNRMCATPFDSGLVTDKELFFAASQKLIDHKRQQARSAGIKMLSDMPLEDLHHVADDVMYIIKDKDRTYHSYHGWQHTIGPAIEVLAGLNIKEGLPYAAGVIDREGGKWGFKVRMLCAALPKYGANAQDALAEIKKDPRLENIEEGRFGRMWRNMVTAIEEDPSPSELVSLEEALQMGGR
ncbi:hypothetical protein DDZ13_02070 [Coraliomargarita sinensis]|uniref:PDZ domain-containing protein n=1 Tax=Coraliomargarita sinensis TaxID=2174842 RepID=A0A317ZQI8_9BACT|nr:DUF6288 domain-containing protein [Coraliomargarita sinensis]PXA05681.1 hypothetical protein DDZ13_02070 [Coraliomargarita sinensis]